MIEKIKSVKKNPWVLWIWNERRRIKGNKEYNKISDEDFVKQFYKNAFNKDLDLEDPITFNEKLNWLKLNYKNPLATQCADKYEVRQYIKDKGYGDILNELIEVYEKVSDIDINRLPDKCVLKGTHGSGWNLIVNNKNKVNWNAWKLIMQSWLNQNFYYYGREWVYKDIKPRIVCEKFLQDSKGELLDYKFLCFNGEPKLIQVDIDRFKGHKRNIYDLEWELTPIEILYNRSEKTIEKPKNLERMISISRDIAKDFPHVRVDFYEVDGVLYFGELTFYHESGTGKFNSFEYEQILGEWLNIENIV